MAEKVRAVCKDDAELVLADVMKETNPGKIKRLGRIRANWNDSLEKWHKFAEQKLEEGNEAKYAQNPELREKLFRTTGTRLVEAGKDIFWGCGWTKANPEAADPQKWKGLNSFGDLLTHLRRRFMAQRCYVEEAHRIRFETANRENQPKRMRTCSPSESPPHRNSVVK